MLDKDESDEDDEEAYKEFLASASEDDDAADQEEDSAHDNIEEYRQKLLGALSSKSNDIGDAFRKRDLQERTDADEEELDIKFNVGFGEDVGKKLLSDKKDKREREAESDWQKYQRKRKEKRREKKLETKEKKKQGQVEVDVEQEERQKAQLEMLIGKRNNGAGEFKANVKDKRFEAVLKNKEYALDPTNKNFKKVAEGEFMKEQKIKRQKRQESM